MKALLSTNKIFMHLTAMALVVAAVIGLRTQPVEARFVPGNPLLVSTRTSYRYCVLTSAGLEANASAVKERVAASMAAARKHPEWARAYGDRLPKPEACPQLDKLPASRVNQGDTWWIGPGVTSNPGPWRTVIMVLDDATADQVLGNGINSALTPYELMQQGDHVLDAATQAVLVRDSALNDPAFISQDLTVAVGLEPLEKPMPPAGVKSIK